MRLMLNHKNTNNRLRRGFTLIEMLIIAPILIVMIGIFISSIITMTGAVLATRAKSALTYSVQDALNRITQDVQTSSGFLATNNIPLVTPQGYNDDTTAFHNANDPNAAQEPKSPILILNTYATTSNPLSSSQNLVYLSGLPNACNSTQIGQNPPMMLNIIYFVKTVAGVSSLWRRTVAQSDYATAGCISGSSGAPWQQPSCAAGRVAPICKTQDIELVDGIQSSGFLVDYCYYTAGSCAPNAAVSDFTQSDAIRNKAFGSLNTVNVTISATNTIAGHDINQTGTIQAVRNDNTNLSSYISNSGSGAWAYKRPITITNSSGGTLTDYQLQISPFADSTFINNAGLVGSWHMNEGSGTVATDSSGSNNTGVLNATSWTSGSSGKFGEAFNANTANYITAASTGVTSVNTRELWFKPSSVLGGSNQYLLDMGAVNVYWIQLYDVDSDGKLEVRAGAGSSTYVDGTTEITSTSTWYHVVVTMNASNLLSLYVNGNLESSVTKTAGAPGAVTIGSAGDHSLKFSGLIDDVKIYNRAITGPASNCGANSANEVCQHYGTAGVPKISGDYQDLRFTKTDGTELSYWQETDGKYWVKYTGSLSTGVNTINMYYGNPSATFGGVYANNGNSTFSFFDDFQGSTIDINKWKELDAKGAITQNNQLNLLNISTAWDSALISNSIFSRTAELSVGGSFTSGAVITSPNNMMVGWESNQTVDPSYAQLNHGLYFNMGTFNVYENSANQTGTVGTYVASTNYNFRVRLKSTGADYAQKLASSNTWTNIYTGVGASLTTSPMRIAITQFAHTGYFSDIYVYNSTATEPTAAIQAEIVL